MKTFDFPQVQSSSFTPCLFPQFLPLFSFSILLPPLPHCSLAISGMAGTTRHRLQGLMMPSAWWMVVRLRELRICRCSCPCLWREAGLEWWDLVMVLLVGVSPGNGVCHKVSSVFQVFFVKMKCVYCKKSKNKYKNIKI